MLCYRQELGLHENDNSIEEEIIAIEQIDRPYSTSGTSSPSLKKSSNPEDAYDEVDISDPSKGSQPNRPLSSGHQYNQDSSESICLPPGN